MNSKLFPSFDKRNGEDYRSKRNILKIEKNPIAFMRLNEDWQKFTRLLGNDKFRFIEQALGRALWSPNSSAFKFPKTHKTFLCSITKYL